MTSLFSQKAEQVINETKPSGIVQHEKKDKRGSVHLRLFKLMLGRTLLNVLQDDKCTKLFNMQVQKENYMRKIINKKIVSLKVEEDQDMILTIAKKTYKNKFEQQFLVNAIKNLEFFENNTFLLEQQHKLCNIINSSQASKGTTLLDIGDSCSSYFILVKGNIIKIQQKQMMSKQASNQASIQNTSYHSKKPARLVYGMHPKLKTAKRKPIKTNSIVFSQQNKNGQLTKQGSNDIVNQVLPIFAKQDSLPNSQNPSSKQTPSNTPKNTPKANSIFRQQSKSVFNEYPLSIPAMFPHMDIVQTYQPGDSFGQVFLLSNSVSEMTLVCGEDCQFLTISKQDYEEIVGIQKEIIMRQKLEFLEQFDIFYNFTNVMLLQILELMIIQKLDKNQIIFKQGDESKFIYFIRQGEVKIQFIYKPEVEQNDSEKQDLTLQQTDSSPLVSGRQLSQDKILNIKKRNSQPSSSSQAANTPENKDKLIQKQNSNELEENILKQLMSQNKQVKPSLLAQFNANLQRKMSKTLDIIILSKNTYFGEEDIISNQQFRKYQASCHSLNAEIFKIDAQVKQQQNIILNLQFSIKSQQRLIKILKVQHTYQKMIQAQKAKTSWYVQRRNELIQFCQDQSSQKNVELSQIQESQFMLKSLKTTLNEKDMTNLNLKIPQQKIKNQLNNPKQNIFSSPQPSLTHISNSSPQSHIMLRHSFANIGFEQERLKMNHQLFQDKIFTREFDQDFNFKQKDQSNKQASPHYFEGLFTNPEKSATLNKNLRKFNTPQSMGSKANIFSFIQKSFTKINSKNDGQNSPNKEIQSQSKLSRSLNGQQITSLSNLGKYEDTLYNIKDEDTVNLPSVLENKQKNLHLQLKIKSQLNDGKELKNSPLKIFNKTFQGVIPSPIMNQTQNADSPFKNLSEFTSPLAGSYSSKDNSFFQILNQRKGSIQFNPALFSVKSNRKNTMNDEIKNNAFQDSQNNLDINNMQLSGYQPSTLHNLELPQSLTNSINNNKNRASSLNPSLSNMFSSVKSTQVQSDFDKIEEYPQSQIKKNYYLPNQNKNKLILGLSLHQLSTTNQSKPQIYIINSNRSIDTQRALEKDKQEKQNSIINRSQYPFIQDGKRNGYLNLKQDNLNSNQETPQITNRIKEIQHIQSKNVQILQQFNEEKFGKRITNVLKLNKRLANSNRDKILNFLIHKTNNNQIQ